MKGSDGINTKNNAKLQDGCKSLMIQLNLKLPTWASYATAGLCFCIISCTIGATMLSSNLCPLPLLSPAATIYRAGFPCAPCVPSTINYGPQKTLQYALLHLYEIRIYLGKRYHCRIVFLYHFLHNQRHHVEQQPLSCSSPECHRHSLPSIFPMCSIHPKYNPLWTPKILQHACSSLHD